MKPQWIASSLLVFFLGSSAAHSGTKSIPCSDLADSFGLESLFGVDGIHTFIKASQLKHQYYISPRELETEDLRSLAEAMIARNRNLCDRYLDGGITNELKMETNGQVMMMVPDKVISSIAQYGFLNQHMTKTTGGCACTGMRYGVEQEISGLRLPYSERAREFFPKYAFFNIRNPKFGPLNPPGNYGNIIFVFNYAVKRRMTWTQTDSLNVSQNLSAAPVARTAYNLPSHPQQCGIYCEAQIWGPLDLTDVDHVLVPQGYDLNDPKLAAIKNANIPILTFELKPNPDTAEAIVVDGIAAPSKNTAVSPNFNRTQLAKMLSNSSGVEQTILNHEMTSRMSSQELLSAIEKSSQASPTTPVQTGYGYGNIYVDLSQVALNIAELAGRPPNPTLRSFFLNYHPTDSSTAQQVIFSLSNYSDSKATLAIERVANDPLFISDQAVQATALAVMMDRVGSHPDNDPLVKRLRSSNNTYVQSLFRKTLCGASP